MSNSNKSTKKSGGGGGITGKIRRNPMRTAAGVAGLVSAGALYYKGGDAYDKTLTMFGQRVKLKRDMQYLENINGDIYLTTVIQTAEQKKNTPLTKNSKQPTIFVRVSVPVPKEELAQVKTNIGAGGKGRPVPEYYSRANFNKMTEYKKQ